MKKLLLAICLLPCIAYGQNASLDSLRPDMLNSAGLELGRYRELRIASAVTAGVGTSMIVLNLIHANNSEKTRNEGYYIGGGLMVVSYVLNIMADRSIGKTGLFLQMASGRIPLNYKKKK